jgi:hypothetical protein
MCHTVRAHREFAEETLGLFGGVSVDTEAVEISALAMAERLSRGGHSFHSVHQLKKVGRCQHIHAQSFDLSSLKLLHNKKTATQTPFRSPVSSPF